MHTTLRRAVGTLALLLISSLLLLVQGCGGGGGDTDRPETLDRMVDEARKA